MLPLVEVSDDSDEQEGIEGSVTVRVITAFDDVGPPDLELSLRGFCVWLGPRYAILRRSAMPRG